MMQIHLFWMTLTLLSLPAAVNASGSYEPSDLERGVAAVLVADEINSFMLKPEQVAKSIGAEPASAEKVAEDYHTNEVAADRKYYEKKVLLSATVTSIKSGIRNSPYLILRGKGYTSPQASIVQTSAETAAKLQRGDHITLVCFGNGSIAGTPVFKNCRFARDIASDVENDLMTGVNNFFSGRSTTSFTGAFMAVEAVALAQGLAQNSGCPSNYARCLTQLKNLKADEPRYLKLMRSAVGKLKASGLDFSILEVKR